MLNGFNMAYLHILEGDMMSGSRTLDYQQIKDRFDGPYMANNGYDFSRATQALENGHTDLVSFASLYISNPDLVERFTTGAELTVADQSTYYGGDEKGYTDYPLMGKIQ
jgi:N-ethylmaleimide reductase